MPPKLPQQEEDHKGEHEMGLVRSLKQGIREFLDLCPAEHHDSISDILAGLQAFERIHLADDMAVHVSRKMLNETLDASLHTDLQVPLFVEAQNAGMIIYRRNGVVSVESFELSPLDTAVYSSHAPIKRRFPASAIAIDDSTMVKPEFRSVLAETVAKMSTQPAPGTIPKVMKASEMHRERRTPASAHLVTGLLSSFLLSVGSATPVIGLEKNTHDEVLWSDCLLPWRRSPIWLLVRVFIQMTLIRRVPESGQFLYKAIMVFYMTRVMREACKTDIHSDFIYAMSAKVSKRLRKILELKFVNDEDELVKFCNLGLEHASQVLYHRRDAAKAKELQEIPTKLHKIGEPVCSVSLETIEEHITPQLEVERDSISNFQPILEVKMSIELPDMDHVSSIEDEFGLLDLEAWILAIPSEFPRTIEEQGLWPLLRRLIIEYHKKATLFYEGDPISLSQAALYTLELWVNLDKACIMAYGPLEEYSPAFPIERLGSLVLKSAGDMERLSRIEDYVQKRKDSAKYGFHYACSNFGHPEGLAVKLFDSDSKFDKLLSEIEAHDERKRQEKANELKVAKDNYKYYFELYQSLECQCYETTRHYHWTGAQSGLCQVCVALKTAKELEIKVCERALPSGKNRQKAVVVELLLPSWLNAWRDSTLLLHSDLFKGILQEDSGHAKPYLTLESYKALTSFTPICQQRIVTIGSQTKPHERTHRSGASISGTVVEDILVENGLQWEYWQTLPLESYVPTEVMCYPVNELKIFQFKMPPESIALDYFSFRAGYSAGPSPNEVISKQWQCPNHLSLDEFKALATLPLGYRIQWPNILLQLASPVVDFNKEETITMILQCIHQMGPKGKYGNKRVSVIMVDDDLASKIITSLSIALSRFEENWDSSVALMTLTYIATRVMSLVSTSDVVRDGLMFLKHSRKVSFGWIQKLQQKLNTASYDKHLTRRLNHCILTCAASFCIETELLLPTFNDDEVLEEFLQVAILNEEMGRSSEGKTTSQIAIQNSWRRICREVFSSFVERIKGGGRTKVIENAISYFWPSFTAVGEWTCQEGPFLHWVTCYAKSAGANQRLYFIQFSLLTGLLLVDGKRLRRLPEAVQNHPSYISLFKSTVFEVAPSGLEGFAHRARCKFEDHELHFGSRLYGSGGNEPYHFKLCALSPMGTELYLLPSSIFEDELSEHLVRNCVHWYNRQDNVVEFRPLGEAWTHSRTHCRLYRSCDNKWILHQNTSADTSRVILPLSSPEFKTIAKVFSCLEEARHLEVSFQADTGMVNIKLARFKLEFFMDSKAPAPDLASKQYRGMKVAHKPDLGTLHGLDNKLVLCGLADPSRHKVLVLDGKESVSQASNIGFTQVLIQPIEPFKIHAYDVDYTLGRLVDNGDFYSKLYLCYMHALTSFCVPDELTGLTGTEQALEILNSAAVQSITSISEAMSELLAKISSLTPERAFYPEHLKEMQAINWRNGLGFLAQHGYFHTAVSKLVSNSIEFQTVFHETSASVSLPVRNQTLVERDMWRSASVRVSEFGVESCLTTPSNCIPEYNRASFHQSGRDDNLMAPCLEQTSKAMLAVLEQKSLLSQDTGIAIKIYAILTNERHVLAPSSGNTHIFTGYDGQHLEDTLHCNKHLLSLFQMLSGHSGPKPNAFQMMMWVGTVALGKTEIPDIIKICMEIWRQPQMALPIPEYQFDLSYGYCFSSYTVTDVFSKYEKHPSMCPKIENEDYETMTRKRLKRLVAGVQGKFSRDLCAEVEKQFPRFCPTLPEGHWESWFDFKSIKTELGDVFRHWNQNILLRDCVLNLEATLKPQIPLVQQISQPKSIDMVVKTGNFVGEKAKGLILVENIFQLTAPEVSPIPSEMAITGLDADIPKPYSDSTQRTAELYKLLKGLQKRAETDHHRGYLERLEESIESLCRQPPLPRRTRLVEKELRAKLDQHEYDGLLSKADDLRAFYEDEASKVFNKMASVYDKHRKTHHMSVHDNLHQPRFTPGYFLKRLSGYGFHKKWQSVIVAYGVAITQVQRAARIRSLILQEDWVALGSELGNIGHLNWSPEEYPSSLLLEIDSGLIIREVQQDIAHLMINPPSDQNCVTQLNMGEGKSSVIVPIVSAALANKQRLMCVVVAKPQAKQMLETLLIRLGGLVNRRVFQVPYSRGLVTTESQAQLLLRLLQDCQNVGGVLLVQPEHLLSIKLAGIQAKLSQSPFADTLVSVQDFMNRKSRFLVDESDENFSVKFELIYTIGDQQPIDNSPQRWFTIQEVLSLVAAHIGTVQKRFPQSVEISQDKAGCFPRICILEADAMQFLVEKVAKTVCNKGTASFSIITQSASRRRLAETYLLNVDISASDLVEVEKAFINGKDTDETFSALLLLRGLFSMGVLAFGLMKKRWRVDYGLDASRTPKTCLAVPYRAKDCPSARAEFSHPDAVMVLTSLSYYYRGLSDDELFQCFDVLKLGSEPDIVYALWTDKLVGIPDCFRSFSGINLEDKLQCIQEVFPHLKYSKSIIDFFLSNIVFPREMREFPERISASGWDLSEVKTNPTTGFSGTNDSRDLLPLGIIQYDRESLKGTNALVLGYLLRPETGVHVMPRKMPHSIDSDAVILLKAVTQMTPPVRVILDVGAQILELDNEGVARKWLSMIPEDAQTQAVVFVNAKDELTVVNREGVVEPLQTSHFAAQLDVCLVFLDEAHTRGIDLKLPTNYRAAVTLGAGLTKDRLTQACMRMRKLGHGQSVIFCVPNDIRNKIAQQEQDPLLRKAVPTVPSILTWCIQQTWSFISDGIYLWANQGSRHSHNQGYWNETWSSGNNMSIATARKFLEPETQTLKERYHPSLVTTDQLSKLGLPDHHPISRRVQEFGKHGLDGSMLNEEQERELAPEIEQEREIQRTPPIEAKVHTWNIGVSDFIETGVMPKGPHFRKAFHMFAETSAGSFYPVDEIYSHIWATKEFCETVETSKETSREAILDCYLRNVQWILARTSHRHSGYSTFVNCDLLVISPFEAEIAVDIIKRSPGFVSLHLYSPRVNFSLPSLDNLDLFVISANAKHQDLLPMTKETAPSLIRELNLFAGQIYMSSFDEYLAICNYLGITTKPTREGEDIAIDGFINRDMQGRVGGGSIFFESPVPFFRRVMTLRRGNASILHSHMGAVLNTRILSQCDFEKSATANAASRESSQASMAKSIVNVAHSTANGDLATYEIAKSEIENGVIAVSSTPQASDNEKESEPVGFFDFSKPFVDRRRTVPIELKYEDESDPSSGD
ncbi:hypothetical protein CFIMG_005390RA [Ceratocystis fimbriata CBS 114723]|uniref:ubiquitinyl hydrolase 1 n=1 Tax=Ceratocystis fimbriata CBS 114723 TaxID=1035309 RepID=A0A2C5WVS4_9PEZI|nr:hypothetical protein CFIMG_005390RA [Ceratocystis fimbriata CBS 114723]